MPGERVEFTSNGSKAQGYLATPASGRGPAVIVIQEWWGLVAHIKAVADRFASAGFVALAPDLYRGESTQRPDEAGRLMMALDIDRAVQDLDGAARYLLARPGVVSKKVGAVGFCMGGQLALAAACKAASVGAVVDFYGVHPNVTLDFSQLAAPVLGLFGERDSFVDPEIAHALGARSGPLQIVDYYIYPTPITRSSTIRARTSTTGGCSRCLDPNARFLARISPELSRRGCSLAGGCALGAAALWPRRAWAADPPAWLEPPGRARSCTCRRS
jgi:carboxymethylenebutenolidase